MKHYPPRKTGGSGWSHRDPASSQRFRRAVKQRDRNQCQRCGAVGVPTHAAHIIALAVGGSNDPSNGRTLCVPCHKATDPHAR